MNPDRDAKTRTDETSGSGMYGDDFENQPLSGTPVSRLGKSQVGQGATYKFREGEWILFPVSIAKFVTMFVFTFGLYSIYWAYKQFDWFKKNGDLGLHPILYCIFLPITMFAICKRLNDVSAQAGVAPPLPHGPLGISYFCCNMADRLHGAWAWLAVLKIIPLIIVQQRINKINAVIDPNLPINSKMTVGNWVIIVIGAILWILAGIGLWLGY